MNEWDAREFVAYVGATWRVEMTVPQAALWVQTFIGVDQDSARRAVDRLAAIESYLPTPQRVKLEAGPAAELLNFEEVYQELLDAVPLCDYFDPSPPKFLGDEAYALAGSVGWKQFREHEPSNTYYTHMMRQRYEDIAARARQRAVDGVASFERSMVLESPEMAALVDGIGADDVETD
jgi:hypothetical protein